MAFSREWPVIFSNFLAHIARKNIKIPLEATQTTSSTYPIVKWQYTVNKDHFRESEGVTGGTWSQKLKFISF